MRLFGCWALIGVALVCAGCGGGASSTTTAAAPVVQEQMNGKALVSSSVTGHELAPGSHVAVAFGGDSALTFSGGCNQLRAVYDTVDGVVKLTEPPASTMMACDPALERQDAWLAGLLADGMALAREGGGYALTSADGATVIHLEAAPASAQPPKLRGPKWVLDTYAERGGNPKPVPAGVQPPTLRFDAAGKVELFGGCNHGGAQFGEADGFIDFRRVFAARRSCGAPADAFEARFLAFLRGAPVAFGWSGEGDLSLARDGAHWTFRAAG